MIRICPNILMIVLQICVSITNRRLRPHHLGETGGRPEGHLQQALHQTEATASVSVAISRWEDQNVFCQICPDLTPRPVSSQNLLSRCISPPDLSIKLRSTPPELPPRNTPRNSDTFEPELPARNTPRNSDTFEPELPPRNTPRNSDTFDSKPDLPERKPLPNNSNSLEPPSSPPTYREAVSSPDYMEVWIRNFKERAWEPIARWRVSLKNLRT